jgi:hypothetical protein
MAKMLIRFSDRRPELEFSRYVIPQIPGTEARSTPVHGVVESFLKSKKYIVPSAIVNPIFAGCVVAVYMGTGAGRFNPAKDALVFNAERDLEAPIGVEDRRSYQSELNHVRADAGSEGRTEKLGRLLHSATPALDADGRPVLRIRNGEEVLSVGVAGSNLFGGDAYEPFTKELLEARLRLELRRGSAPKVSESDVTRDWALLEKAMNDSDNEVAMRLRGMLQPLSQARAGNRP